MKKLIVVLVIFVVLVFMGSMQALAETAVNADNPGEEIKLVNYIKIGQTNIVDFYSDFCPPCRKISPMLSQLDKKRSDIVVIKVDMNRKGHRGIDWRSPLAQQFKLTAVPHFKIYDSSGKLTHEGKNAINRVFSLLQQEGITK
jgi:thiol-disulfide isomerase/thioredoxin